MKRRYKLLLVTAGTVLMIMQFACNKMLPAGFWENYQSKHIQANESDQGPRGGHRRMMWKSEGFHTLNKQEAINYALKNGWQLTDSLVFANDSLNLLSSYSEANYSYEILKRNLLPTLNANKGYTIFVFETGWIAVEPGNFRETEKNGFIVFDSENTELIVFHLWGE